MPYFTLRTNTNTNVYKKYATCLLVSFCRTYDKTFLNSKQLHTQMLYKEPGRLSPSYHCILRYVCNKINHPGTRVKITLDAIVQYVCFCDACIGLFYCTHYFEPVYHPIRKKETDKKFIVVIGCLLCHATKMHFFLSSCMVYAK